MDMMLVLKKINMTAIWTHANAHILINTSLVIFLLIGKIFIKVILIQVILLYLQELLKH